MRALKELVDNAWDADADQVSIQLPKPDAVDVLGDDFDGGLRLPLTDGCVPLGLNVARALDPAEADQCSGVNQRAKLIRQLGVSALNFDHPG